MAIQVPNETPAIQQYLASGFTICSQSSADAAEVEPQHREAPLRECVIEAVDHLIVHRPTELGVRMQDQGDRTVVGSLMVVAGLDAPGRTIDDKLRHVCLILLAVGWFRVTRLAPSRDAATISPQHSHAFT